MVDGEFSEESRFRLFSDAPGARSVCPGRFFAEETGFCIATALLWAFEIECVDRTTTLEDIKWVDSAIR